MTIYYVLGYLSPHRVTVNNNYQTRNTKKKHMPNRYVYIFLKPNAPGGALAGQLYTDERTKKR